MSLPATPPSRSLSCRFCNSGMFLGNGTACYVCMHLARNEKLGKPTRQAVPDKGCTVVKDLEDPVGDWISLVAGLTKRLNAAKLKLEEARQAQRDRAGREVPLSEGQLRIMAEIEQADKDWIEHLRQEVRHKLQAEDLRTKMTPPAPIIAMNQQMVPPGTVHIAPLTPPPAPWSDAAHKDEGLMKRIDAFLAEPLPAGAVGAFSDFEAADKAQSARNAEALLRPADAVECGFCEGAGHVIEAIMESPNCRVECSVCCGRGWMSVKAPVLHPDPADQPEYQRTGDGCCDACGRNYSEHEAHQFGVGPFPLVLRKLCYEPPHKPRFVKL